MEHAPTSHFLLLLELPGEELQKVEKRKTSCQAGRQAAGFLPMLWEGRQLRDFPGTYFFSPEQGTGLPTDIFNLYVETWWT